MDLYLWLYMYICICVMCIFCLVNIYELSTKFGRLILDRVVDVLSYYHRHRTKIDVLVHRLEFVSHPGQCAWKSCSLHAHRGTYTTMYEPIDPIPCTKSNRKFINKISFSSQCFLCIEVDNETYSYIAISRTSNKMLFMRING